MPIASPNGRLAAVATVAIRRLSLMAVHSSGLSVHHSLRIVSPHCYFSIVKPWASNRGTAFGDLIYEKKDFAASVAFVVSAIG